MGAKENAEIVRRGYEAFNTADMETLTELFDESAVWRTPGKGSVGGVREGRDAVFALFGRYGGETEGTFKADLKEVVADDDGRVIAIHHNSGERNGKHLDVDCCLAFRIEDGRVTEGAEHFFDLYAWDEFWS